MKKCIAGKKPFRLSAMAMLSFLGSLALCSFIIGVTIVNRENIEKLQMEQLILEKTFRINEVISRLLYRTNSLATLIIQKYGIMDNFDIVAPTIANDPTILNILIAPNSIVSNIYPLSDGNDAVLGFNFFDENIGNKEAIAAMEAGALVLGGPFMASAQGAIILVGRLPVYIDTPEEKNKFWGLVSVTLRFPQALDDAGLNIFNNQGFTYELWRISPDTNERQVIASNYEHVKTGSRFIEKQVHVLNADWYLKVWPDRVWYNHRENLALIIAGILISLLVFFVMQNNIELKRMRVILEGMAKTDPLTGIFNRRYFMEMALINIEKERRLNGECYIIIMDLDRFKSINDTYGHVIGDNVLIEATSRIKANIRPYDLFARYGGEEFIIFASNTDKNSILKLSERLRLSICSKEFECNDVSFTVSASFGIANMEKYDIGKAIVRADKALYKAKENGRNRAVFWEENKA